MKNNKYKDTSKPSCLVTKSKRYWTGSKRNKVKHGASKKGGWLQLWENRTEDREQYRRYFFTEMMHSQLGAYSTADIQFMESVLENFGDYDGADYDR